MHTQAWDYRAAKAQAWADCGLAVFKTTGVVAQSTACQILENCQEALEVWAPAGLVADYTQAEMLLDSSALLDSALRVTHGGGALSLPTALVVHADDAAMFRIYADLMARNGIVRGVFTDQAAAMAWVRLQAQVWEAERLHRSRVSAR